MTRFSYCLESHFW